MAKSEFGTALQDQADKAPPDLEDSTREPRYPAVPAVQSDAPASDLRTFWRGRPLPKETESDRQVPPVSALLLRREGDYPEFWHREKSFLDTMAEIYERVAKGLPPAQGSRPGNYHPR